MIFRVRFSIQGGHVHCRLFCAPHMNQTFAKCGDFVVRRGPEFIALLNAFSGAQFIGDDENIGIVQASRERDEEDLDDKQFRDNVKAMND